MKLTIYNPYLDKEEIKDVNEWYVLSMKVGTWFMMRYFEHREDAEFMKTELELKGYHRVRVTKSTSLKKEEDRHV